MNLLSNLNDNKNRGISTTIGYAATLSITVILLGLLVGAFSVQMNTQIDNAKQQELDISGSQLATEIEKVDASIRQSSTENVSIHPQFSATAGNEDYRISVNSTARPNIYRLQLETPEGISSTATFRSQTPVNTDDFANSTRLQITYSSSDGEITLENRDTINRTGPRDVGPAKNISGNYTIPAGTEEPEISATGDINGGEGSIVNDSLDAGGSINTDPQLTVYGTVDAVSTVSLAEFTYVTQDVSSQQAVSIEDEAIVDGTVTTAEGVSLDESAIVGGDVDAGQAVTLARDAEVSGNIGTNESVTLFESTRVGGNITTSQDVSIEDDSGVGGNIDIDGGLQTDLSVLITGNVSADGFVSIGENTRVDGDITNTTYNVLLERTADVQSITTGGDVTTRTGSFVGEDIDADGTITLGDDTTVEGDVLATDASSISCGNNVTINGQDCSTYVSNNY